MKRKWVVVYDDRTPYQRAMADLRHKIEKTEKLNERLDALEVSLS